MDELSVILAALTAGATKGLAESASEAVRAAYGKLRGALGRRLSHDPDATKALDNHEKLPEVWGGPLRHALKTANVAADPQVLGLAQSLLALLQHEGSGGGTTTPVINQSGSNNQASSAVFQGTVVAPGATFGVSVTQPSPQADAIER